MTGRMLTIIFLSLLLVSAVFPGPAGYLPFSESVGSSNQVINRNRPFIYLSDQRVVTVELIDTASIIVNYINLGETYELFDPKNIVIADQSGRFYRGHLIKPDNPESVDRPFEISELLKPGTIVGYEIVGNFDFQTPVEEVLFRVGGRILKLEPISSRQFEVIAARIGELDISAAETKTSLLRAGFRRGYGQLYFAGSAEAAEYESAFTESEIVAPVPVATPMPRLPSSEYGLPDPVVVRIKAIVSRAGGLKNLEIAEGLNAKLDRIAVETVRNSWIFLPAIADDEIAESELILRVIFRRNDQP